MTRSSMHVVILGNSAAGLSALESFRRYDVNSRVTLVSAEPSLAYSKVLLPYYLRGRVMHPGLFIRCPEDYVRLGAHTRFADQAREVDFRQHTVLLDSGETLPYDRLLIATGATPSDPPIEGLRGPGVHHLWTLRDALELEPLLRPGKRVIYIGSGLVCLQGAWAACSRGLEVQVVECMDRILPHLLDKRGSDMLSAKMIKHGVDLRMGLRAHALEHRRDGSMRLLFKDHPPLYADLIIVGTGVRPNTLFLKNCGKRWDDGLPVGSSMETGVEDVYAAGDVALGRTVFDESRVFMALWSKAVEQGAVAGANMAGQYMTYQGSLNMNITEMFGITIASIGRFTLKQGDETWMRPSQEENVEERYFRIVMENRVPVGGFSVGTAEDAQVLGFLRTLILNKRQVENIDDMLRKRDLHSYGLYRSRDQGR